MLQVGMPPAMVAAFVGSRPAADYEVHADCWDSVRVFCAMGTQWAVGFSGPVGLRYEALPVVMDLCGVSADQRPQVFDDLRTMEGEALRVIASQR